jgi:hypothetical protein
MTSFSASVTPFLFHHFLGWNPTLNLGIMVDRSTTATDQLLLVFIHLNVIEIYGATRLRIMTLSIMTFSIITLNMKGFMLFSA